MFSASNIVNGCNYAFHFVASRRLGPENYGELYARLTALGFVGVLESQRHDRAVPLTAELASGGDMAVISALLRLSRKWSLIVAAAAAAIAILMAAPRGAFLQLQYAHSSFPGRSWSWEASSYRRSAQ